MVNEVMRVGENLHARVIFDRMLNRYGASHHHLPRNVVALSSVLKGAANIKSIPVPTKPRRYTWRREE